jgi:hypothetical protein
MHMRFRVTPLRVALAAGALSLVLAGGAIAVATNPYTDAAGAYHGCVGNGSGVLRVLADGESCRQNETAIEWNQQGVQGPQGIQGPKGDKGDTGDTGATGAQGPQGIQGPVGPAGPAGPQGEKGDRGDTGATGAQGQQGIQGPAGPAGAGADYVRIEADFVWGPNSGKEERLLCPAGKRALSGGYEIRSNAPSFTVQEAETTLTSPYGFTVAGSNGAGTATTVRISAVCATW